MGRGRSAKEVEERVKHFISLVWDVDRTEVLDESIVKYGIDQQRLGNADSLDFVELVMALEEEFGFDFPDAECELWETVKDIVDYIKEKV